MHDIYLIVIIALSDNRNDDMVSGMPILTLCEPSEDQCYFLIV